MTDRDKLIEAMARAAYETAPYIQLPWEETWRKDREIARAQAALAAIEANGLVVVPREPTEAMKEAAYDADDEGGHFNAYVAYRAMLAAALAICIAALRARGEP